MADGLCVGCTVGIGCGIAVGSADGFSPQIALQVVTQSQQVEKSRLQVEMLQDIVAHTSWQVELQAWLTAHSAREVGALDASSMAAASAVYFLNIYVHL